MAAASLRIFKAYRTAFRCRNALLTARNFNSSTTRNSYIVLLPEIPTDTTETNALLRTESYPYFNEIEVTKCVSGLGKLVLAFEASLSAFEAELEDSKIPKDFNAVFERLDRMGAELDYPWSTVRLLQLIRYSEVIAIICQKFNDRVTKARVKRHHSVVIHDVVKELSEDKSMSVAQRRVIKKYLLEARLNGIGLSPNNATKYEVIFKEMELLKNTYRHNVALVGNQFRHKISSFDLVRNFPQPLIQAMSENRSEPTIGPWTLTLQQPMVDLFLQHCPDRTLRFNAWFAFNSRASSTSDHNLYNSVTMEKLRDVRDQQAKLLGYNCYADLSMETKMAGNVQNVQSMIISLLVHSKPKLESDLDELQDFADLTRFGHKLDLWDLPFYRRRHRIEKFQLDEVEIRNYFPYPIVLEGLFRLCSNLFGIKIERAKIDKHHLWHRDVQFFRVFNENDKHLGSFFLDPYSRPTNKLNIPGWLETGRRRNLSSTSESTAYLIFNFPPPVPKQSSLLDHEQIKLLFSKFGQMLQHLLTTVPYGDVSGSCNLEWDAVNVCPEFMSLWLSDPQTLSNLSGHCETGERVQLDLAQRIISADKHMKSYDLTRELYLSDFDLKMYDGRNVFWLDLMRKMWPKYMPFPLHKDDSHPCSFSEIFSGDYPAAYFSNTWSQMVAADIFSAFQEKMADEAHLQQTGRRFLETYLSLGGACPPGEMFRRFRGRDPSPEMLVSHLFPDEQDNSRRDSLE